MKTKEQAFTEVMQKQMEYDFLHHKEEKRTSKEIKRDLTQRLERINKTLKEKLSATVLALMMIFVIGLTSCDKEPIEQRELITQELTLKNIYTMPMTKGFDINTWVYEYNTTPAIITFTNVNNPAETVTQSVTIQQLQNGISLNIFSGTYNITYQTIHSQTDASKLNIKIDMPNTVINGTPIALTATYDDYLLVVDMPNVQSVFTSFGSGLPYEIIMTNLGGVWYAYANTFDAGYEFLIRFNDLTEKRFKLTGRQLGMIYWYTSPINAGTTITFPEWIINKITL